MPRKAVNRDDRADRAAIRRAYDEIVAAGGRPVLKAIYGRIGGGVTSRRCEELVREMRASGELAMTRRPDKFDRFVRERDAEAKPEIRRAHDEIMAAGGVPSKWTIYRSLRGAVGQSRCARVLREMRASGELPDPYARAGCVPTPPEKPGPGDHYLRRRYYLINRVVDRRNNDASRIRAAARIVDLLVARSVAGHRRAKPAPGKPDAASVRAEAARLAIRDGRRAWESVWALLGPAGPADGSRANL